MPETAQTLLRQGLTALGIENPGPLQEQLLAYMQLLLKWNRLSNLTALRQPRQIVTRHLLDSLALAPHIPAVAHHILDVGSGAGLPGVPLALLYPHRRIALLDSRGRKTRFLFQVKTHLGLANMSVHKAPPL